MRTPLSLMVALLTSLQSLSAAENADTTHVAISGRALNAAPAAFTLDYGTGRLQVDMDAWAWYQGEGNGVIGDRKVRVFGMIDREFSSQTTLEATAVQVEGIGVRLDPGETGPGVRPFDTNTPINIGDVELIGTVTQITGREFTVGSGAETIAVDTSAMKANPLDQQGQPRVEEGVRVHVTGRMAKNTVEDLELDAVTVTVLQSGAP